MVSAFGGFLVAKQAVARMLPKGHGAVLFTGASASVKGYRTVGGLRDGQVRAARPGPEHGARAVAARASTSPISSSTGRSAIRGRAEPADEPDSMLDPDAIAATIWAPLHQPRSAWSWEVELRPWVERF